MAESIQIKIPTNDATKNIVFSYTMDQSWVTRKTTIKFNMWYEEYDLGTKKVDYTVTINGTEYSGSTGIVVGFIITSSIAHEISQPNLAAVTIPVTVSTTLTGRDTVTGNFNISIPAIPDSSPTIKTAPNFNDETTSVNIIYSNPSGTAIGSLRLGITDVNGNMIISYRDIPKNAMTTTFTFSEEDMAALRSLAGSNTSIKVKFALRYVANGSVGYAYAERTFTVIQKYAIITSSGNFDDESNPKINYSNPKGSAVSSLEVCIASSNGSSVYVPYRSVSKTGTSYTFNLTDSERKTLRTVAVNSKTLSVRFYIRTVYNGTTYTSYSPVRTLSIINAEPTMDTPRVLDIYPITNQLTGAPDKTLIKGYNIMSWEMNPIAQKEATIVSYSFTCGSFKSTERTGSFERAESGTFVFTATDSRGYTVSKTVTFNVIDYFPVTCNYNLAMELETGGAAAKVVLDIDGNFFNGSFGAKSNELQIYTRSKLNNGEFSDWGEITILVSDVSNGKYHLDANLSGFEPSGTYTFQYKAVDALTEVITEEYVIQLYPIFDWSKEDFNFNVPVTIQGNTINDFIVEQGTDSMGSNGTWYWSKWASGRAECYGCRNYGNMAITTAWGGLYRSGSFDQSLPYGLFVNTPEYIDIRVRNGGMGGWVAYHENSAPSATQTGGFIVVRPASATSSQTYISFHAIGRWK